MESQIITKKLSADELIKITKENFGDMVKVDVDIKRNILTIGGEWHSEGQDLLVKNGSSGENVWGCNFYPWRESEKRIEYISLINIKPSLDHKKMDVRDEKIREKISSVIHTLLLDEKETLNV